MKKNIIFIVTVFFCFCATYFYSLSKTKNDTIYFFSGNFKKLFHENNNGFFNLAHEIEKHGYKVKETRSLRKIKNAKYVVVFDIFNKKLNRIKRLPSNKLILFTWEPEVVIPENYNPKNHRYFSKIFTTYDDFIDNKKYFKLHYPNLYQMKTNVPSFEDKKLCCLISANKTSNAENELYSERINAIKFFEEFGYYDFDLYGKGWNKEEYPSYKGTPDDKSIISNYKFSICYENTKNVNGYITEKIFDSFKEGCVPVYLGAENITDYIPSDCFIDKRDFKTYNELYIFLKMMSEKKYQAYLDNIKTFISSKQAQPFSEENLIATFKQALELKDDL